MEKNFGLRYEPFLKILRYRLAEKESSEMDGFDLMMEFSFLKSQINQLFFKLVHSLIEICSNQFRKRFYWLHQLKI